MSSERKDEVPRWGHVRGVSGGSSRDCSRVFYGMCRRRSTDLIVVPYECIGLGSRLMNETLIYHGPDDARSLACWGMIFYVFLVQL